MLQDVPDPPGDELLENVNSLLQVRDESYSWKYCFYHLYVGTKNGPLLWIQGSWTLSGWRRTSVLPGSPTMENCTEYIHWSQGNSCIFAGLSNKMYLKYYCAKWRWTKFNLEIMYNHLCRQWESSWPSLRLAWHGGQVAIG